MALDMFFKIGDIKGESQDKAHKDEIDVMAWSWGMTQNGSMHNGGGGGSGKVRIQDITLTKNVDKSTPNLMAFCSSGKTFPEAKLVVRKAGDKPLEYMTIVLKDVLISGVSTGGSGGQDQLTENVTLNFAKVNVEYQPQKNDGSKDGGAIKYGWNIAANTSA